MTPHGPWRIVSSQEVYRDPWMSVRCDRVVRPDGTPGTHSVAVVKAGVCVIALDANGVVHLTEEFHYGVGRVTIEGVSGGIEPEESAMETAKRELREELGLVAGTWTNLGSVDPFTASVVSPTQLYLAEDVEDVPDAPEGTEVIRRVTTPLQQAARWAVDGTITHAPSCTLVLRAWMFKRGVFTELGLPAPKREEG